jgi:hypothetical protein
MLRDRTFTLKTAVTAGLILATALAGTASALLKTTVSPSRPHATSNIIVSFTPTSRLPAGYVYEYQLIANKGNGFGCANNKSGVSTRRGTAHRRYAIVITPRDDFNHRRWCPGSSSVVVARRKASAPSGTGTLVARKTFRIYR